MTSVLEGVLRGLTPLSPVGSLPRLVPEGCHRCSHHSFQGFCPKSCGRWWESWCCDRAGSGVPLAWSGAVFGLPEGRARTRQEVGPGSWSLVGMKTRGVASKNRFTANGCQQLKRTLCSGEQSKGGTLGPWGSRSPQGSVLPSSPGGPVGERDWGSAPGRTAGRPERHPSPSRLWACRGHFPSCPPCAPEGVKAIQDSSRSDLVTPASAGTGRKFHSAGHFWSL